MSKFLDPITNDSLSRRIAFALAWRNAQYAEYPYHYFVPYPGQQNVPGFLNFYNHPYTIFENNMPKVYGNVSLKQMNEERTWSPYFCSTAGTEMRMVSQTGLLSIRPGQPMENPVAEEDVLSGGCLNNYLSG